MTIGEKIFKYRKQAGLSQEELADRMNVTRQSVSLWETDQTTPSLESLISLAEIFGVSLDDLCGTSPNNAETAQPCTPAKSGCLASVQIKYTVDLLNDVNRLTVRKIFIINIIAVILSVLVGIGIIISDTDNIFLIIPILFIVTLVALLIRLRILHKKHTAEFFTINPNCVAKVQLFNDSFELEITSDNSNSKSVIRYSDIKKVQNAEKYVLIYFGNSVVPIEKNLPDTDYDLIIKLLNMPIDNAVSLKNRKLKTFLVIMFILSLLTIVMALISVAICVQFSPLPDFSYTFQEYLWLFLLFIPLPLASAILGIVFYFKKYKCLKNVIAGIIMCALLSIFGSISFIYKDYAIHDFGYVKELEQTISIDLPDSGYISYAINTDSTTNSVAMIKFDDANEIYNTLSTDERFSTNVDFIPLNFIDLYYSIITSDYHYFMLFDVANSETNVIPDNQSEEHRFIYIAYHIDKNILFVLDFVK